MIEVSGIDKYRERPWRVKPDERSWEQVLSSMSIAYRSKCWQTNPNPNPSHAIHCLVRSHLIQTHRYLQHFQPQNSQTLKFGSSRTILRLRMTLFNLLQRLRFRLLHILHVAIQRSRRPLISLRLGLVNFGVDFPDLTVPKLFNSPILLQECFGWEYYKLAKMLARMWI